MVLSSGKHSDVVRRLYRKARGWNRIAKAAVGWSRQRAYRLKKQAIERIRELCPDSVRLDELEWLDGGTVVIGLSIFGCGRLHLVLEAHDYAPGGAWWGLPWDARHLTG